MGKAATPRLARCLYSVKARHLAACWKLLVLISKQEDDFILCFFICIMIKLELQAAQAAACASQDRNTLGPLRSYPGSPSSFSISTVFRPHPKTMKVSICQLPGNFFGSLNFSPNSGFKTTPRSLPREQGPHCSSPRKEHASWGLSGHDPLPALTEGRSFVLGAFLLVEKRSTYKYLSVGLIR